LKWFFGITVAWRGPSGPQVLMNLHGEFKKWSIWIGAETNVFTALLGLCVRCDCLNKPSSERWAG